MFTYSTRSKKGWTWLLMLLLITALLPAEPASAASTSFLNPVGPAGSSSADPHVFKHTDGYYYYTHTSDAWDKIDIVRSKTLSGIGAGERKTVFTKSAAACTGTNCYSKDIWAPELHYIDGAWYLYFSAGGSDGQQRMFVMKNTSANPLSGSFGTPIKLKDSRDQWAIDHTVAKINGQLYIAWSQSENAIQRILIAKMSSPTAISGTGVVISEPTNAWEKVGGNVNEGPAFITHGSKVHLAFSASGCWEDAYKLGLLSANLTSDLTVKSNWTKAASPIFQQGNGVYGPGHNSFTKSPDGTEDWIVYHANAGSGQGCYNQRTTRIQKVTWNGDTPVLGAPAAAGTLVTRPSGEGTGDILYRLRNKASGKVMSVDLAAAANGANIWQWTNYNKPDQLWTIEPAGSGYFKMRASHSGNVADVVDFSTAAGANVAAYPDINTTNQHWKFISTNNMFFKVQNRGSSLMLDVENGSLNDGANIRQWTDNGLDPQQWIFERAN